jgi:Icc-related predicted phosphoesterase
MYAHIFSLIPGLVRNRLRYGRYLDVFVAHAPPAGIHDKEDLPHQGIQAFRWLIKVFRPDYFFHGHIHVMRPDTQVETVIGKTRVINTFGFRETFVSSQP